MLSIESDSQVLNNIITVKQEGVAENAEIFNTEQLKQIQNSTQSHLIQKLIIDLSTLGYKSLQDLELPPFKNVNELKIIFQNNNRYEYEGEKEYNE